MLSHPPPSSLQLFNFYNQKVDKWSQTLRAAFTGHYGPGYILNGVW